MTQPMTLTDLRTSLNNFMPTWATITIDEDGQVVIYTNLTVGENDELQPMD